MFKKDELRDAMFSILSTEAQLHPQPKLVRPSVASLVLKMTEKYKSDSAYVFSIKESEHLDFIYWLLSFVDASKDSLGKKINNFLQYLSIVKLRTLEFQSLEEQEASLKKQEIDMMIFRICQKAFSEDPEKSLLTFAKIFDSMFSPLYFVDFVRSSFERTTASEVKILALNCLLVLVGKYSYEYDNFYTILYQMVQEELIHLKSSSLQPHSATSEKKSEAYTSLFDNKHTPKFLRVLEIAFRSNRLSKSLTTSFIKVS